MRDNIILDTDSYKASHFRQFPPGTERIFGYLESRGGRYGSTLFFGLQYLIRKYLTAPITQKDVDEAAAFFAAHGEPFPINGWRRVVEKHNGYLPLRIRAVPEGTVVPVRNVLMTVESTDSEIPWIVGWFETQLMRLWYPITVATRSFYCKRVIAEYLKKTANDPMAELPFKLHDFGARGVSSAESAGVGGMAHLVNFKGTDTVIGARYAQEFYGTVDPVAGFSIPAMEHSTVTAWGPTREADAFRNMILAHPDHAMVACVSDSYDIENAVENIWADDLLDLVKASNKVIVIRPDSGNPASVNLKLLSILERKVGMQQNSKGYKVLPKFFRLIQGDGNDDETAIEAILSAITGAGYSASNIAFGMGGGLLQKLDRDTQRFAFKVSQITVNGERRDVWKRPTSDLSKASKKGQLDLVRKDGQFRTVVSDAPVPDSELVLYYENGVSFTSYTLDNARARSEASLWS